MIKHYFPAPTILIGALLASTGARAQEPVVSPTSQSRTASVERRPDGDAAPVLDDDGWRVFLITRGQSMNLSRLKYHGGDVISSPRQISIFLGAGWSDPDTRLQEAALAGALAELDRSTEAELNDRRVATLHAQPIQYEQPWQFEQNAEGDQVVSDLQVQQVLSSLLENHRIIAPDQNLIYVVFLAPELKSTVGGSLGRKHYLAYHNFFHVEGNQIRYVVMPFEPNTKAALSIAGQALARAALNPSGAGWF